jgi:hypothetical protein
MKIDNPKGDSAFTVGHFIAFGLGVVSTLIVFVILMLIGI